jgi:hypothetical protein
MIGLVSMGESGPDEFTAWFDYVRMYRFDLRDPKPLGEF